jgi:glycyl-tRNA synthetase (class II)
MKKRHFIVLFLFLFIISIVVIFTNGQSAIEASESLNKDKIKTVAQNILNKASEKVEESAPVVTEKIKETVASTYKVIQEKGEEAINTMIIEPSMGVIKNVVKKVISTSSSILTSEDIKEVLANNGDNSCDCQ